MKVIAGKYRGRPLRAPPGRTTRPTAARVREALFGILGDIHDLNVLDLCAGSGALGIEALSRGARQVCFVDPDRAALEAIKQNLETLGVSEQSQLLALKMERAHKALLSRGPFDLVLCDPPWPVAEQMAMSVAALLTPELLSAEAIVVIGHRADRPLRVAAPNWTLDQARVWGDSGLSFFHQHQRHDSAAEHAENR